MQLTNLHLQLGNGGRTQDVAPPAGLFKVTELLKVDAGSRDCVAVPMSAEDRQRVRRRLQLPGGPEVALALPTGTCLYPGDVLYQTPEAVYVVEACLEEVLVITPTSLGEAANIAHFIGNLHRDIDIAEGTIRVLYEAALEIRLQKLARHVTREARPFRGRPPSAEAHAVR